MPEQTQKEIREAVAPNMQQTASQQNPKRRYEIEIFQADYEQSDASGNPIARWKKIVYEKPIIIEASCKEDLDELQRQYALCDQQFRIIRPLDPPTNSVQAPPAQLPSPSIVVDDAIKQNENQPKAMQASTQCSSINNDRQIQDKPKVEMKPRIISIGDIQLKYDGDKIYQKQWIKLSQAESANIRVVNDGNNKIFNLQGKHFEAKRWVLVEQNNNENDDIAFVSEENE